MESTENWRYPKILFNRLLEALFLLDTLHFMIAFYKLELSYEFKNVTKMMGRGNGTYENE